MIILISAVCRHRRILKEIIKKQGRIHKRSSALEICVLRDNCMGGGYLTLATHLQAILKPADAL
jgi:hypothetical protein